MVYDAAHQPDARNGLPAELTISLIHHLFTRVQHTLVDGEALDILDAETPVEQLSPEKVIDMLWKKTGVLYDFAGRAGAATRTGAVGHHPPGCGAHRGIHRALRNGLSDSG